MGPSVLQPEAQVGVDQHPHIGLSTLTYLLEGEIEYRDSLGSRVSVRPGDVAFMTAGRGVTHTERPPAHLRDQAYRLNGYQLWVALPAALEEMEPSFQRTEASALPKRRVGGLELTLVVGEGFGLRAPIEGYSPLFMVDVITHEGGALELSGQLRGEVAVIAAQGELRCGEITVREGQMLVAQAEGLSSLWCSAGSRALLLGGEPLPEPRHLLWNFVSSRKGRLQEARQDWVARRFPEVVGDESYVPFPGA